MYSDHYTCGFDFITNVGKFTIGFGNNHNGCYPHKVVIISNNLEDIIEL